MEEEGCNRKKKGNRYFLFVLICPTCPQFAHLRWVPVGFEGTAAGELGDPVESAAPSVCTPFCLSRAIRRSLFRSSLMSSSSSLRGVSKCSEETSDRAYLCLLRRFSSGSCVILISSSL